MNIDNQKQPMDSKVNDFSSRYDSWMKFMVVIGDMVICNLIFFLAFHLGRTVGASSTLQSHLIISAIYFACIANGGVILHIRKTRRAQIVVHMLRNMFWFVLVATPVLLIGSFVMPVWWLYLLCLIAMFMVITAFRIGMRYVIEGYWKNTRLRNGAVLVGSTENNAALFHELADDPMIGYRVLGYFDFAPNENFPAGCEYLGEPKDVVHYLEQHKDEVSSLYCCLPSRQKEVILPIVSYCENHVVRFYSVPNVRNYISRQMHFNMMGSVPCLSLHEEPLSRIENRMVKRAFDIVFSLLFLCTLFIPILIVVTIITELTMPGPVFFRQKRNGLNGKEFTCIKFRSMKINDQADTLQATKNDPRKTKWGNIMRKTNIDELPQFINVLLGDMSIVGPRPHMLKHTEEYSKLINKYMVRHYVRPGITGYSQVTGFRGETKTLGQMEGRIKRDIWYIEHWSFWLDIYIIIKTVTNVFKGDDEAY